MNFLSKLKLFFSSKNKLRFSLILCSFMLILIYITIFRLSVPNTPSLRFQWQKKGKKYITSDEEKAESFIKYKSFYEKIKKEKNIQIFFTKKELYTLYNTHPKFSHWLKQIKFDLEKTNHNLPKFTKDIPLRSEETFLNIYYKLDLNQLPILKFIPYLRNRSFYGKLETKPVIINNNIGLILKNVYWNDDEYPTSLFGNLYQFKTTKNVFKNINSIQVTPLGVQLDSL